MTGQREHGQEPEQMTGAVHVHCWQGYFGRGDIVEVQEVGEPGHDEQTEDEHTQLDRAMGLLDEIADDAAEGRLGQRNCEEDAQRMAAIFRGDRARGVLEKDKETT